VVAEPLPATADEANLAPQVVAAADAAMDCLRLAQAHWGPEKRRHGHQHDAPGARRKDVAAARPGVAAEARRGTAAASDKAAWTEYCALGLVTGALSGARPAAAAEQYAIIHPQLAAHIRALGGMPETVMPGLDPAIIVAALLVEMAGSGPAMTV
jgi:hypothetical protein